MKNIAILGSTGSIGTQTLDVVRANGDLRVLASVQAKYGEAGRTGKRISSASGSCLG